MPFCFRNGDESEIAAMRIYDDVNKQALDDILIMLTPEEIQKLIDSLENQPENGAYILFNDEQQKREITIGVYTPENLHIFSSEVVRVI
jgi:hypothetical protein